MNILKISKTREVKTPTRGTTGSAGLDFYVPEDIEAVVNSGESALIPSGIKANVPEGHALIAFNKSSVASKLGLVVGACVIDEDYQGEIIIHLLNVSPYFQMVAPGMKIVQFLLVPVVKPQVFEVPEVELFENETERGSGGFGSTGKE